MKVRVIIPMAFLFMAAMLALINGGKVAAVLICDCLDFHFHVPLMVVIGAQICASVFRENVERWGRIVALTTDRSDYVPLRQFDVEWIAPAARHDLAHDRPSGLLDCAD